jgi:predicted ATPase with chaperone activity
MITASSATRVDKSAIVTQTQGPQTNAAMAGRQLNDRLPGPFVPQASTTLQETGLSEHTVLSLVFKLLLGQGAVSGRSIAEQIAVPFGILERLLQRLKNEHLVVLRASAPVADYIYQLTESGAGRARREFQRNSYCGTAPVAFCDYLASTKAQSVGSQRPKLEDVRRAFQDLVLSEEKCCSIGEAIESGLGFFLHGAAGNGKSTIAERTTKAFGDCIWIPQAVEIEGEIVRLFDPTCHELASPEEFGIQAVPQEVDKRWVCIRRPTIIVGGELTLDKFEITPNRESGLCEAPIQMKANGGTLVLDDFGRQRISPTEILNRLIMPLERRVDYLRLPSGRTIQMPFESLMIFSTNLDPAQLVDEAFLRRVPYKIEITDPSVPEFFELFRQEAARLGITWRGEVIEYLLKKHYLPIGRSLRFCHPRDLLRQVATHCSFRGLPPVVTATALDAAVQNYFGITSPDSVGQTAS